MLSWVLICGVVNEPCSEYTSLRFVGVVGEGGADVRVKLSEGVVPGSRGLIYNSFEVITRTFDILECETGCSTSNGTRKCQNNDAKVLHLRGDYIGSGASFLWVGSRHVLDTPGWSYLC